MITYEDALKKARELKHNIDACDEYDVGYMFKAKADAFTIGGDGPCCIIKDTGRAVCQTEFYERYEPVFIGEKTV
ncbi:MAG: hypothetical protein J5518_01690 [Lachnospiraceae bacterium]|nr:hypothetical protein [Lachnospiraceae bacterium]